MLGFGRVFKGAVAFRVLQSWLQAKPCQTSGFMDKLVLSVTWSRPWHGFKASKPGLGKQLREPQIITLNSVAVSET